MAREHGDQVSVVGIGNQDNFKLGEDFKADTGVESFPLWWEDGNDAWQPFEFSFQPSAVLLSPDGQELKRWSGPVEPDEVLAALPAA